VHNIADPMLLTVLLGGDIPHRRSPLPDFTSTYWVNSHDHEQLTASTKK